VWLYVIPYKSKLRGIKSPNIKILLNPLQSP